MKVLTLCALSLFIFIGSANARNCDPDEVRQAQAHCVRANTTYRGCKVSSQGYVTAVCQAGNRIIESRIDRAVPMRPRERPRTPTRRR